MVICGRRLEKLKKASSAITPAGERVLAVKADVTSEKDIGKVVRAAAAETGGSTSS